MRSHTPRTILTAFALLLAALLLARPREATPHRPEAVPRRVPDHVTLWGRPIGGLDESQLAAWLRSVAPLLTRPAQDARVDPVTGGVVPDLNGAVLDPEATAAAALAAAPGPLAPVFRQLPARVRLVDFPDLPVYRGHPEVREVAFLFNVAWGQEELPPLLAALRSAGVTATFFLTGRWVRRYPDLARAVAAAGHEIASHGDVDREDLPRMGAGAVAADFARAAETIAAVTGVRPAFVSTHRGVLTPAIRAAAARVGQRLVMWTVDTVDWMDPPPARILARVERGMVAGALVLAHPRPVTVRVLPELARRIRARGYRIVPLGRLLDPTLRPELLPALPREG